MSVCVSRQASDGPQVVISTDALSVLGALDRNTLGDLSLSLQPLCAAKRVVLQWVPSHCGINSNKAVRKQGGTRDDNTLHLSPWTPNVIGIERKEEEVTLSACVVQPLTVL